MYSFNLMSRIDRLLFSWCLLVSRPTSASPHLSLPFIRCVKKPIAKSEWWNVISSELIERTAVTTSCLHCTIHPLSSPRLLTGTATWNMKAIMYVNTYYLCSIHTQTRTVEWFSIQVLNWMSTLFSVLLVHDSNTNSHPGVSMQGICLIATYTFCRQCLEQKLQTTLSEHIRLKHQKERDALPLFCF